jgi:predicted 3-demethylubiquinone-9 3-methyltransferase (glyoxalase superfamily)
MQGITTFLTFDNRAEEAVNYYVSTFPNSKVTNIVRHEFEGGPLPKGALLTAVFELNGREFMAMDGGPDFTFAQGTSLMVSCETQEEIDAVWSKLSAGGEEQPCGWVKDKFGVSWQVVPTVLGEYMTGSDPAASQRVMEAFLKMSKFDIATLKRAYEGT